MNEEQTLQIVEYQSQRVLTTAQIARAYDATEKHISKNFTRNKDKYREGKHYYILAGAEKRAFLSNHPQIDDGSIHATTLYLWTEKGAWLHAKSLNTDRAWEACERLIDEYYRLKSMVAEVFPAPAQQIPFNWVLHERLKLFAAHTHLLPGRWCVFKEVACYAYLYPTLIDAALPDGSVGKRWMKYVREHPDKFDLRLIKTYDHRYPDKRGTVQANQYPNEWLAEFRFWFEEVYLKEHLQQYLKPRVSKQLTLPEAGR